MRLDSDHKKMKKVAKSTLIGFGLALLLGSLVSLTSTQCVNYKIQGLSFQKVKLITKDTSLPIDDNSRSYYLLHFEIENCNCKLQFFKAPNPYFIKGSIENIYKMQVLDSCNIDHKSSFKTLNLRNILAISSNEKNIDGLCCSFINFNEIIKQINTKKGYGEKNNILSDCLLYLDADQSLPKKIIIDFSSYSLESIVNNDPVSIEIEKNMDLGKPTDYNW